MFYKTYLNLLKFHVLQNILKFKFHVSQKILKVLNLSDLKRIKDKVRDGEESRDGETQLER